MAGTNHEVRMAHREPPWMLPFYTRSGNRLDVSSSRSRSQSVSKALRVSSDLVAFLAARIRKDREQ